MYKELINLPLSDRHERETKYMDSLQQPNKKWKRYYCISTQWVTNWLRYVEANDKSSMQPPGPVDNEGIMIDLCK